MGRTTTTSVATTLLVCLLITTCHGAVSAQTPSTSDEFDGYAKVTPSMVVIIVVLIAALFFMGFFSIYIRHCSESAASGGSVRPALGRGSRQLAASRGLDANVIGSFPTMQYSEVKGLKFGDSALECAVCLNEFVDEETLRLIPKCDHVFHPECIDAWLSSHVTCPVCRANLTPQPGDDVTDAVADVTQEPLPESSSPEMDVEAQEVEETCLHEAEAQEPELRRNRTRGSWRTRGRWFPRSHSTGHSLVQPGENTDRFTLRLPAEVRKQIMSRQLDRTMSLVVLPRERSSRRGFRTGAINEGSSRGKNYHRLEKLGEPAARSDPRVFSRNLSFFTRASSFLTRASSTIMRSASVRSPKPVAKNGEGTSMWSAGPDGNGSNQPPV